MNNKVNSVLNSIEKIDNLIMEADVSVSDAMSDVYSKQFKMEGNVTEDYINHEYYQESVIAGILIGGGIIAVLATAIVLITKHVKKSASGDPEKKNDTSTAAGVSLDKPEEFNKKVEQLKSELEKAGGKLTISDVGFDASKLKQKYDLIKELCGYAETFLKGTEDDEINGALTQFNDKLTEINGIDCKLSGEVDVTPASLDEIKSLAGPIQQMTAELEKVSKEFEKRSKENKNANTGEMDDAKKERFEKLKEGLNQINKGSTDLGKSVDNEFSIIRKYFEAVSKAAKEKDKPSETESEKKSESEKSQETPQNPDILKQKIYPITAKWAAMNGNSDPKHPDVKLTADEAYNIISDIHTDVANHRYPNVLRTLKAKANEDPTKAMLIKNLIEATIDNKDVFNTEDEETINEIKSGLPELETIAANAPSEEPKKDETKPESEETKESSNNEKKSENNGPLVITISSGSFALNDIIREWSNENIFTNTFSMPGVMEKRIDRAYTEESAIDSHKETTNRSYLIEIKADINNNDYMALISNLQDTLSNIKRHPDLMEKLSDNVRKKLMTAFHFFFKRNKETIEQLSDKAWPNILNSFEELYNTYVQHINKTSDTQTDENIIKNKLNAVLSGSGETETEQKSEPDSSQLIKDKLGKFVSSEDDGETVKPEDILKLRTIFDNIDNGKISTEEVKEMSSILSTSGVIFISFPEDINIESIHQAKGLTKEFEEAIKGLAESKSDTEAENIKEELVSKDYNIMAPDKWLSAIGRIGSAVDDLAKKGINKYKDALNETKKFMNETVLPKTKLLTEEAALKTLFAADKISQKASEIITKIEQYLGQHIETSPVTDQKQDQPETTTQTPQQTATPNEKVDQNPQSPVEPEPKADETTNTPPVENKEENTEQLSEKDQKLQVAFEQLESKLDQVQQKYPNGLSTIGIATGCDPRTFSGVVLTQFIENKSEAEIKEFSNNLMDCLVGGFFRNPSQTHAKANSQLPAPCKEAIDAMQNMIDDGYEVGNSLMGTNYTPDNLSKYKGYTYKGNFINKLMKITPEDVLTSDVFNDVKLGNPENSETPEEPSPEETNNEETTQETPETKSEPHLDIKDTLRYVLQDPAEAIAKANSLPEGAVPTITDKLKNALIAIDNKHLWDFLLYDLEAMGQTIDLDSPITRKDARIIATTAYRIDMMDEAKSDLNGYLKLQYRNNPQNEVKQAIFDEVKRYANANNIHDNLITPQANFIPADDDKITLDLENWKNDNRLTSDATDFAEKQKGFKPPKPKETTINKKMTTKYLNKLKNNRLTTYDAKDFAEKQKYLGSLGFNPPKIEETDAEEHEVDNTIDDTKSNVASYESPYKSPDIMYDSTFTGNTNSDIERMLINRMYGADKDEAQQITSDTIQNKLNRLNLGNDDTEETVSLEELKNLPSLMSDAVSGKLTDDGAKKLASNIMQLKLAIVWPTDVIEATNIDYATDITKKILSDCDTVSSSGDQNTIEQMKSDIVNVQKNPETEITSTPEEALNKIVDLTGKVTNLIKSAAVNGANNISVALNSTKRFVSEVVLPGMHAAASMGSNAATNTIEKAKSLVTIINNHLTGSITSSPISNDNTVQSATPSTENADTTKEPSTTRVKYDSDIMFMPAAPVNIFKNVPDLGSMDATQVLSELFNTFDYINKPTGSKYYRNHEDTDFTQGDLDFINSIRGQGGSLPLRKKSELASNSRTLVNHFNSIYSMLKTIGGNNAMNRYNPTSKKLVVDIATTLEQYLGYVQAELEESHKDVLTEATPMMNKVLDECERIKNIK